MSTNSTTLSKLLEPAIELNTESRKNEPERFMAVISPSNSNDAAIAWQGEGVSYEIEELSPLLDDFFNSYEPWAKDMDHGIWVWEGRLVYTGGYSMWNDDCEVTFQGKWRPPTRKELNNLCRYNDPWYVLPTITQYLWGIVLKIVDYAR